MYQLIESISIKNGVAQHINWHEARMNRARRDLFALKDKIELLAYLEIPEWAKMHWAKCRIFYGKTIEKIEFEPYHIRPIHSLQLVADNSIEYSHKFKNRTHLTELFAQRGNCDNILIVKNGFITDSYYSNVVFENQKGYFTPDTPLLCGTQRARLLASKKIQSCPIRVEDIKRFERIHLINAFMELGDCVVELAKVTLFE